MVPRADHHCRTLRDRRRTLYSHPREPRTELLQPSQAARRLDEPEVSLPGERRYAFVERRYLLRELPYAVFEGQG